MAETVKIELEIHVRQPKAGKKKKRRARKKRRGNFASDSEDRDRDGGGRFVKGAGRAASTARPPINDEERERMGAVAAANVTDMAKPLGRVITGGRFEASLSRENMRRLGIRPRSGARGK